MPGEFPIGAHLTTPRWGYRHHGIYAGHGRVIHYAGFSRLFRARGPVEEVSLAEFAAGRRIAVEDISAPSFPGPERVARARARIGENRYRLLTNNCEHFAAWCIGGTSCSGQVDAWRERIAAPLAALLRLRSVDRSMRVPAEVMG